MSQNARIRFPGTAGSSLRDFLAECPPGAVVDVAPGRYDEPLVIDRPLTLRGAGELTRLGSRGRGSVIHVRAGEGQVKLESLALDGGDAEEGGALHIESGWVVLNNLHLRRSRAGSGGGLHVCGGSVQASLLRLTQLEAERGGAIRVARRGSLELRDALISNTVAGRGGAIAVDDAGRLVLQAVTLQKSRASESGGGQALFVGGSGTGAPVVSLHRVRFADAPIGRPVVQDRGHLGLIQVSSCDLPKVIAEEPGVVDLGSNHWR